MVYDVLYVCFNETTDVGSEAMKTVQVTLLRRTLAFFPNPNVLFAISRSHFIVLYDCHNRVVVVVVVVLMQMLVKDGLLCECCDSDYVCNSVMLCRLMLYCSCCSCCCVTDSVSGGDDTFH